MGELTVLGVVESVLGAAIFSALVGVLEWARRKAAKPEEPRPKPHKRRRTDRYWLRLAVGIVNPKWASQARSGETVRQTLTLVWDIYVWRRRLTRALAVLFALLAIYSIVSVIVTVSR